MLGCFNWDGQIWTTPNVGLKMQLKHLKQLKVEVGLKFYITFLTQHLGLSIFYPNLASNNPALFRVYDGKCTETLMLEFTIFILLYHLKFFFFFIPK